MERKGNQLMTENNVSQVMVISNVDTTKNNFSQLLSGYDNLRRLREKFRVLISNFYNFVINNLNPFICDIVT